MWSLQKRQQFESLREPGKLLSDEERAELASLTRELEDGEAAYLRPVNARLQAENALDEQRLKQLDELVERKRALLSRLRSVLTESLVERDAIQTELASVLAASTVPDEDPQ